MKAMPRILKKSFQLRFLFSMHQPRRLYAYESSGFTADTSPRFIEDTPPFRIAAIMVRLNPIRCFVEPLFHYRYHLFYRKWRREWVHKVCREPVEHQCVIPIDLLAIPPHGFFMNGKCDFQGILQRGSSDIEMKIIAHASIVLSIENTRVLTFFVPSCQNDVASFYLKGNDGVKIRS